MQCESTGGPLQSDGELERLCEALVNAAADWWARQLANDAARDWSFPGGSGGNGRGGPPIRRPS